MCIRDSSGNIIANSYRIHAITPRMLVMDVNNANVPNASGAYMRVKIGVMRMAIACAIVVPETNFSTSLAKLLLRRVVVVGISGMFSAISVISTIIR